MGEKADRIEKHIEQQRNEIGDNIIELKYKVRRSVDWRAQVEERPLTMVGLAFGAGFLVSALFDTRSGSSRATQRLASADFRSQQEPAHGGTFEILRGAVIGLAATKLKDFVEELLPGFQDEYQKAQASKRAF